MKYTCNSCSKSHKCVIVGPALLVMQTFIHILSPHDTSGEFTELLHGEFMGTGTPKTVVCINTSSERLRYTRICIIHRTKTILEHREDHYVQISKSEIFIELPILKC